MTAAVHPRRASPSATARTPTPAVVPPEARGVPRDGVRLLVAAAGRPPVAGRFTDLPRALEPGDLVVVNTSATEPAALDAVREDGRPVVVHVSGPLPSRRTGAAGGWVVELRSPQGTRVHDGRAGEALRLPLGGRAVLVAGHPDADRAAGGRLWRADLRVPGPLPAYLAAAGRPITYSYLRERPPIGAYQTIFARRTDAGFASAEMPSAARPFSAAVVAGLRERGVGVTTVQLHTGVASLEAGEEPLPERFAVPPAAAAAVNATRAAGGRIVAVGTTVTRALETVADRTGAVRAGRGWTELVLSPDRPARVVDGLVTGWHEPEASHLLLLRAVAGSGLVDKAYEAAYDGGFLWHEFGDSCLLLAAGTSAHPPI
jgi:S-adenosylmethionine:tRNA ribosyltransferase-isomerase